MRSFLWPDEFLYSMNTFIGVPCNSFRTLLILFLRVFLFTFGCNKNHIVRAALESIPYQIKDVVSAMEEDSGKRIKELKVDGGISTNRFVVQLLADLLNAPVINMGMEEVSALGAAYLAGLEYGVFKNIEQLKNLNFQYKIFSPGKEREKVMHSYEGWKQSIQRYLGE